MNLPTTSDQILLVTGGTQTISTHASWVDSISSVISLGRQNTSVSSATSTTIVGSPLSGYNRHVKSLIVNNEGAVAETVAIQQTDGTTISTIIGPVSLSPGNTLYWSAYGPWSLIDTSGDRYGLR